MIMVSVIIPTFKRRDMLFYEIEQLKKQQNVSLEIIVINDNIPNDPTDDIINVYPDVKYVKYPTKIGPGQKRQVGFALSTGDFIATPDDDDYLIDNHFYEKAISIMNEDSSISFVSGSAIIKYEEKGCTDNAFQKVPLNVCGKYDGIDYLEKMMITYNKPLSSFPTLWRRLAFQEQDFMGQIETSDVSLYMLGCLGGNPFFISDYVGVYRVHSRSLTKGKSNPSWIINVLSQKEVIFSKIKVRLQHPRKWWLYHVSSSYQFFSNTSKSRLEKIKVLKWAFCHSHGYLILKLFAFKRAIAVLCLNK